jgi:hypothetical protein
MLPAEDPIFDTSVASFFSYQTKGTLSSLIIHDLPQLLPDSPHIASDDPHIKLADGL